MKLRIVSPLAGSLKKTSRAVASICAFNIALHVMPPQVAALTTLYTYVATTEQLAVGLRFENGWNVRR